ncbi:MAG: Eco57I restriction-modification methylase domain-containing protein [Candidatus Thorarchaeota archaeon]|jgi:hypothetical protein
MLDERNQPSRVRRRTGTYYTPWNLAYDIAGQTLRASLNSLIGMPLDSQIPYTTMDETKQKRMLEHVEEISVLDPAVGEGVFLAAAAVWLENTRKALGDDRTTEELRLEVLRRNLFGVDIRPEAVSMCSDALVAWTEVKNKKQLKNEIQANNIKHGNSLIGWTQMLDGFNEADLEAMNTSLIEELSNDEETTRMKELHGISPFHWPIEFNQFMAEPRSGFDIVLGNPPYGNILSPLERSIIRRTRGTDVSSTRKGTWNIAALFIARSHELLRLGGQLGFLIPNSVLRTKQFFLVRRFLLEKLPVWKIVDEASPFDGVTLEMVSIFSCAADSVDRNSVKVESRRTGIKWQSEVPRQILESSSIFPIYYDKIMDKILSRSTKGWATARRGRDMSKSHVNKTRNEQFKIPYATSGRSVKRFRLDSQYLIYADDSFLDDSGLRHSHENNLLVATKNYPYPRCVVKPKGVIHGGGIVEITPLRDDIQLEALGLILNSTLVRYICIKYLTNYSQLTTCLNTGIMEELPLMMPEDQTIFTQLFMTLQELHRDASGNNLSEDIDILEEIANALIYEMYLLDSNALLEATSRAILGLSKNVTSRDLIGALSVADIANEVRDIMNHEMVRQIETAPRMRT